MTSTVSADPSASKEGGDEAFSSVANVRVRRLLQTHVTPDSKRALCLLGFVFIIQESPNTLVRLCGLWSAGWLLASRFGWTKKLAAAIHSAWPSRASNPGTTR